MSDLQISIDICPEGNVDAAAIHALTQVMEHFQGVALLHQILDEAATNRIATWFYAKYKQEPFTVVNN